MATPVVRGAADVRAQPIDWTADFDALLSGLASNYANFEYTITERRVDLPALAARHRTALADAQSDDERRAVFQRLLRDFRDPHVGIDWKPREHHKSEAVCPDAGPAFNSGIAFARLENYRTLSSDEAGTFYAGLLQSTSTPPVGVIRIPLFVERSYPAACQAAAIELGLRRDQPCDEACAEKMDRQAVAWLNRALLSTVHALQSAGARSLVIDITNNGGGSDWAEVVARVLGGSLQSAQVAMLKHPAWTSYLARQQQAIEAALVTAAPGERLRLEKALGTLKAARAEIARRCDLNAAWIDRDLAQGQRALPCSTLVRTEFYASGWERSAADHGSVTVDELLFTPAQYGEFAVGTISLPLIVMIDRDTHSAAEQFAALLRDNGRAVLIGEPTAGAACGTFTTTGTGFNLPSSGAHVRVPDCVRLRADGSNERRGVTPDRWIPWAPSDSAYQRAVKAAESVRQAAAALPRS